VKSHADHQVGAPEHPCMRITTIVEAEASRKSVGAVAASALEPVHAGRARCAGRVSNNAAILGLGEGSANCG
jgi:hypothetical protein